MEEEPVGGIGGISRIWIDHNEDVGAVVGRDGLELCSFESDCGLIGSDCTRSARAPTMRNGYHTASSEEFCFIDRDRCTIVTVCD